MAAHYSKLYKIHDTYIPSLVQSVIHDGIKLNKSSIMLQFRLHKKMNEAKT